MRSAAKLVLVPCVFHSSTFSSWNVLCLHPCTKRPPCVGVRAAEAKAKADAAASAKGEDAKKAAEAKAAADKMCALLLSDDRPLLC